MYRQIFVHPEDAKDQRILFRKSIEHDVEDFKLQTVTFGVNCAPYLALRTLQQFSEDEQDRLPLGAKILRVNVYRWCPFGDHDKDILLKTRSELITILEAAGFQLRKLTANAKWI